MKRSADGSNAIAAELEAISALARNRNGPVADTYDRLQGLVFLRAAQPRQKLSDEERLYVALHQAKSLIFFNVAHLFALSGGQLTGNVAKPLDQIAGDLRWCAALLKLGCDISATTGSLFPAIAEEFCSGDRTLAEAELIEALTALDSELAEYQRGHPDTIAAAVGRRYLLSGDASALHSFKVSYHLLGTMLATGTPPPVPDLLSEVELRLAVHSLNTRQPTYLMQFRLLHQIPEIIGAVLHDTMISTAECLQEDVNEEARRKLGLIRLSMRHVIDSLWPLIELLLPSRYYRIRSHLGVTSGSNSSMLSKRLFSTTYYKVAEVVADKHRSGKLDKDIFTTFLEIRESIVLWRELHLFLPWSILGRQATSLIGSKDAPEAVRAMRATFEQRDPLRSLNASDIPTPPSPTLLPSKSILHLLDTTGAVTRRRFRDVEDRTGRYARKGGMK